MTSHATPSQVSEMMKIANRQSQTYCLADAGFFFNTNDFSGHKAVWSSKWKNLTQTHSVDGSLNADCMMERNADDQWECFMGNVALQYIKQPTFMAQVR